MNETTCDYNGCENSSKTHEMFTMLIRGEEFEVCSEHEPKVNDDTGYCGSYCQLGYGCSQEC